VPAAPEGLRNRGRIQLGHARAHDAEHPLVHLHQADQRTAIGHVDDLVREVGHALHVLRPADCTDQHVEAVHRVGLGGRQQRVEEAALRLAERGVEVLRDHVLARAVAQTPRECLRVPERHARVAE
jgi:hypothetical protein